MRNQHFNRSWLVLVGLLIGLPILMLCLVLALPFLLTWIPEGKWGRYDGFSFKIIGSECVELVVTDPSIAEIYVLVGDSRMHPSSICVEDLKGIGFERVVRNSFWNATGGVQSIARIGSDGTLQNLRLPAHRTLTLPFAARADGPLLKLPVGYDEVVDQFGKPNDEEWIYWDGSWR